jgi:hypothetical protein
VETAGPGIFARRAALLRSARLVIGESGLYGGALAHPDLADALAAGVAEDVARLVAERAASARTLDDLVACLVGAAVDGAALWEDGLALANAGSECLSDFGAWSRLQAPWVRAIDDALVAAQARGIVRADVDAASTALVLRDTLDRTAKACILFGHEGYRETAVALIRAALRA